MVLWGRSVLGRQKFRGRFHQGSTNVPPSFSKFRCVSGSLGEIRFGLPKGSAEGSTKVPPSFSKFRCVSGSLGQILGCQKVPREKVPPRFHQASPSLAVSLVLWGRSVLGCQKVPRKVPPRFRQGSTNVPPSFSKFRCFSDSLGQIRLGLPKGSAEGSTKLLQVSLCLWFSGADPSWLPKGSAEGSTKVPRKVPPSFSKFRCVSGSLQQIRLGLPKGSAEGSTKVPQRFHQGSANLLQVSWSLVLWGGSVLGCQKVLWKVHQGFTEVPPRFHQGCTKVVPKSHQGSTLRSGA